MVGVPIVAMILGETRLPSERIAANALGAVKVASLTADF